MKHTLLFTSLLLVVLVFGSTTIAYALVIVPYISHSSSSYHYTDYSSDSSLSSTSSTKNSVPDSDPAAAPNGSMTVCQKQQYWLNRGFNYITEVNAEYDQLLAIYYQKECER